MYNKPVDLYLDALVIESAEKEIPNLTIPLVSVAGYEASVYLHYTQYSDTRKLDAQLFVVSAHELSLSLQRLTNHPATINYKKEDTSVVLNTKPVYRHVFLFDIDPNYLSIVPRYLVGAGEGMSN